MKFENTTVTDEGVTKIKKITILIPLHSSREKNIEITTTNRELIHIAINNQALLNDFSKNTEFVYERILQILLRSDDVSLDDKCMFEDWNYQGIKFKNWSGKKCTPKEKKVFYTNKSDKIFERINGNKSTTWRDYMNLVSHDPNINTYETMNNITGINKS